MSSVTIEVDTSDYDRKIANVRAGIDDFRREFIQQGTILIQQEMANFLGNQINSISSEIDEFESITGTHTGYGLFVDQPTAPHVIRPNISKFLRFTIGGQVIYAREVQHPGTKGKFFIQRTLDIVMPQLLDVAKSVWSGLVNR